MEKAGAKVMRRSATSAVERSRGQPIDSLSYANLIEAPESDSKGREESGSFFFALLFNFAVDAECCHRSGFEASFADLFTAEFTDAELTLIKTLQSFFDFIDQLAFTIANPELKTSV